MSLSLPEISPMAYPQSAFSRFSRSEHGSVAIIFAISIIPICGAAALAVDYARVANASVKLSAALDRAALAGAKLMDIEGTTTTEVIDRTTAYFNSQIKILGMPVDTSATLNVAVDWSTNGVTAKAKLPVKSAFAAAIGMPLVNVEKSATVVYKMKKIELSLVLDVTGSMLEVPSGDTKSKMEALKTSAKEIVDTMYDLAANDQAIRIALTPFSSAVNAGTYATTTAGTTWSNTCLIERTGADEATDAYPSGTNRPKIFEPPVVDPVWAPCPTSEVIPLQGRSQRAMLKSEIDNFTAIGGTAGHIGTAWGYYLISNKWASMFPTASKPNAPADDVVKNVVIMTDGVFNLSYLSGALTYEGSATSESYKLFNDLCDNMKKDKINIYTIGFGLGVGGGGGQAESELKKCATTNANFFLAANGTELQNAFKAIADRISQLRLSK